MVRRRQVYFGAATHALSSSRARSGFLGAASTLGLVVPTLIGLGLFGFATGCRPVAHSEEATSASRPSASPALNYRLDPNWPSDAGLTFNEVSWATIDRVSGNIYLLQRSQPAVSVVTPDGSLVESWTTDQLGDPHSISVVPQTDGTSEVWITDMAPPQPAGPGWGHCLKRFDNAGDYLGSIGTCAENSAGSGLDPVQFDKVTDVAVNSVGNLLVTDGDLEGLNNRVLELSPTGEVLMVRSAPDNQPGSGPLEFDLPHDIVVDDCGRAWIADALNHRIQVMSGQGEFLGQLACFAPEGVYGIDLSTVPAGHSTLFVASSPTTGGGQGTVWLFDVSMACTQALTLSCKPIARWDIQLPPTTETAMLHSIAASSDGGFVVLAELGGTIPPQKWVAYPAPDASTPMEN